MSFPESLIRASTLIVMLTVLSCISCDRTSPPVGGERATRIAAAGPLEPGPRTSGMPVDLSRGWCSGHAVPESVCTRCNARLIPQFKDAGDWCAEHERPESQCDLCNPGVAARWATLDPANAGRNIEARPSSGSVPDAGAAVSRGAGPWCFEHDVPEAECTRCNPELIAVYKAKGDWCAGHGLPESHCVLCNPELEAKFAVLRPERPSALGADVSGIRVEQVGAALRPENDPFCEVESTIIRFVDPSIARKAGIDASPAERRRLSASVTCPAELRYDATRLARITPRAEGLVAEVSVDLGDDVEPNQALAVIDSPIMGESKAAYIDALQRHAIARADLDRHDKIHGGIERMLAACSKDLGSAEVRQRYAEVRIGEYKSRLLNAHAQLELTRGRFERETSLLQRGISSQEAFDTSRRDVEQAEAEFAATHEAIEIEMEKEHLALSRALTVAEVTLDAARRRLRILGISDKEIGALDAGEDATLSRYAVRSPMGGKIVDRQAVVGESVTTSDTMFAIADTARLWLMLSLEERDLVSVDVGDRVLFTVDGLPGRSFEGRIDWIASEVKEPTRTIQARVPLPNDVGILRAHMFGQALIVVHDNDAVLTVPQEAVQTDGCCNIVFVKESETVYRPRKVELGSAVRGAVEVLSGLDAGEEVVTTGTFLLKTEVLKSNIGAGCCEVDPGR
jgi:cobalt-zinc-cadmium efflux system membrane fusion protein